MFSQKKSYLKGKWFYFILIGLFAFGYWVNQPPAGISDGKEDNVNTDSSYQTDKDDQSDSHNDTYDIMEHIIGEGADVSSDGSVSIIPTTSGITEEKENTGYYLVKEVNGIIKIFYYDDSGNETLIRTTDIAFSLLSINDQALFKKGIIRHSQDELEELLQDFES